MRKRGFFIAATVMMAYAMTVAAETKILFLTAGQSNTDGRVTAKELPDYLKEPIQNCRISYHSPYNQELAGRFCAFHAASGTKGNAKRWAYDAVVYYNLTKTLDKPFYVVKCSYGGTSIDPAVSCSGRAVALAEGDGTKKTIPFCGSYAADGTYTQTYGNGFHWSANPDFLANTGIAGTVYSKDGRQFTGQSMLKAWAAVVDAAIDSLKAGGDDVSVKAIMWHQGESDKNRVSGRYHDNLKAVVAFMRQHLAEKLGDSKYLKLPFYCGTVPRASSLYNKVIEDAMYSLEKEDDNFHVIDLKDLTMLSDRKHFDGPSAEKFGNRLFKELQSVTIK